MHIQRLVEVTYPSTHTSDQSETVTSGEILIATRAHGAICAVVLRTHTRQVRLAATSGAGEGSTHAPVHAVAGAGCGAVRAAVLPDLAQFTAELLTGHGPVVANVVTQLDNMTLDLELVLLQPGYV